MDKEKLMLNDQARFPDEQYLMSLTGENYRLWFDLNEAAAKSWPGSGGEWRYYNDGKQWLFKFVLKKKTLFWAAAYDSSFKVTFYFTDKILPLLDAADLPVRIKDDFKTVKAFGKLKPVSVFLHDAADISNIMELISLKAKS